MSCYLLLGETFGREDYYHALPYIHVVNYVPTYGPSNVGLFVRNSRRCNIVFLA